MSGSRQSARPGASSMAVMITSAGDTGIFFVESYLHGSHPTPPAVAAN